MGPSDQVNTLFKSQVGLTGCTLIKDMLDGTGTNGGTSTYAGLVDAPDQVTLWPGDTQIARAFNICTTAHILVAQQINGYPNRVVITYENFSNLSAHGWSLDVSEYNTSFNQRAGTPALVDENGVPQDSVFTMPA